ncbi:MAG TPA: hypothetical protein VMW49_01680 [Candidatus Dormibacteraeota bacterium]|nr:hypothetical protein [Candidatus Dormibacteraeota bacterium]
MTMFELTATLWRRKLLTLAVAVALFAIGTAGILATRHTTYTATSEVIFNQPGLVVGPSGSDVSVKITNLLPTFCALLASNQVASAAGAVAGVSEAQAAAVSCTPQTNTLIALLTLHSRDSGLAQRVVAADASALVSAVVGTYDYNGVPRLERVTAQVIQRSRSTVNSNQTARDLGLVGVGAVVVAAAFSLAAEPHRRDWLVLPPGGRPASVQLPPE